MHLLLRTLFFVCGVLLNTLIPGQAFAQDGKLVFALDLIRHGDRTPIGVIPKAPHAWAEGLGQLTARGMQQEFQLGVKLHKQYIQNTSLLPSHYVAETMHVRSTDYDRTLMSAQSLLMGLYPPGSGPKLPNSDQSALPSAFQPIPIHTRPITEEPDLFASQNTEKAKALLVRYVFSREDWKDKTTELEPNFPRWSQLTGITINNLFQLINLGDTLRIYTYYHIPLPQGMTEQEANVIIESGAWAFTTIFKPREIGEARGGKLLATIKNHLMQATDENVRTKFVLLSAHDSTTLALMSAMHIPLESPPPYASDLNFSLYETGPENYTVRVTYNGQPLLIPGCDQLDCPLSQFPG